MVTRIPTRHQGMFYVSIEILYKIMSYFMSIDPSLFNPATTTNYEAKKKNSQSLAGPTFQKRKDLLKMLVFTNYVLLIPYE